MSAVKFDKNLNSHLRNQWKNDNSDINFYHDIVI